jgi:hypothetical protein
VTHKDAKVEKQRLEEAVWRVQGLSRRGRMSQARARIIDEEMKILADALGVRTLAKDNRCPVCGSISHE